MIYNLEVESYSQTIGVLHYKSDAQKKFFLKQVRIDNGQIKSDFSVQNG